MKGLHYYYHKTKSNKRIKMPWFCDIYDFWFYNHRDKVKKILEIGIGCGNGLRAYIDYFPNAHIYGVDIIDRKWNFDTSKITTLIGDQAQSSFLKTVVATGPYDIIIDDGGHKMIQQKRSFMNLFGSVAPGGLYSIEDLHTSYWPGWGGGYKRPNSTVEYLKGFIDVLNETAYKNNNMTRTRNIHQKLSWLNSVMKAVHFYKYLVIIEKK